MNKKIGMWFAFAVFVSPALAHAADDTKTEILGKVETYIAAYNAKDTDRMSSVTAENFPVTSLRKLPDGDRVGLRPFRQVKQELEDSTDEIQEENWASSVFVDGSIAVVMLRHRLLLNNERLHCGTDAYNLMLIDGEWVITGLQYSMEEDGCPEDR